MPEDNQKRTVLAPQPIVSFSQLPVNRIISIELDNDEDVEWTWTSLPSGERFVSGYTIIKKVS